MFVFPRNPALGGKSETKELVASSSSFLCEVIDVVVKCGSIPLQSLLSRQTAREISKYV